MYGWRTRIGLLVPSVNVAVERQVQMMAPEGVMFHTTRLRLVDASEDSLMAFVDQAEQGATLLADAGVDLIVFNCTSASMLRPGLDDEVIARITKATGVPATTTSKAVVSALEALGARRIVLTSPYRQASNDREIVYLESHQISVLDEVGLALSPEQYILKQPGEWYRQVRAQAHPEAEAYFISCTAIRAIEAIAPLERDLARPVITSNQSMVWHALRLTGVRAAATGYGRLMDTLGEA